MRKDITPDEKTIEDTKNIESKFKFTFDKNGIVTGVTNEENEVVTGNTSESSNNNDS